MNTHDEGLGPCPDCGEDMDEHDLRDAPATCPPFTRPADRRHAAITIGFLLTRAGRSASRTDKVECVSRIRSLVARGAELPAWIPDTDALCRRLSRILGEAEEVR